MARSPPQAHGLGCDHVHEGTSLHAGKHRLVEILGIAVRHNTMGDSDGITGGEQIDLDNLRE